MVQSKVPSPLQETLIRFSSEFCFSLSIPPFQSYIVHQFSSNKYLLNVNWWFHKFIILPYFSKCNKIFSHTTIKRQIVLIMVVNAKRKSCNFNVIRLFTFYVNFSGLEPTYWRTKNINKKSLLTSKHLFATINNGGDCILT